MLHNSPFSASPIQELCDRALVVWSAGGFVERAPSCDGLPEARALCEALAQRISESEHFLCSNWSHGSPHVVAYCLLALDLASSSRILEVPKSLREDLRRIPIIFGCFADKIHICDLVREIESKHTHA
jgi:hypothetical protein